MRCFKPEIPSDLNQITFDWALYKLRDVESGTYFLVCSEDNSEVARRLAERVEMKVVVVPQDMLKTRFSWGLIVGGSCAWSDPAA